MLSPQTDGALELFGLRVLFALALYAFLAVLLGTLLRERPAETLPHPPTAWLMSAGDRTPNSGLCYAIRSGVWIGRDPHCAICINDTSVGERHACMTWAEDAQTWYIEDGLSESGTFVNGQRVSRVPLADGDVIQVGGYRLVFLRDPRQTADAPPVISSSVLSTVRHP
jgi:hypothetical protein